jgi:hypothetical protein
MLHVQHILTGFARQIMVNTCRSTTVLVSLIVQLLLVLHVQYILIVFELLLVLHVPHILAVFAHQINRINHVI